jgi:hypothetical protein
MIITDLHIFCIIYCFLQKLALFNRDKRFEDMVIARTYKTASGQEPGLLAFCIINVLGP